MSMQVQDCFITKNVMWKTTTHPVRVSMSMSGPHTVSMSIPGSISGGIMTIMTGTVHAGRWWIPGMIIPGDIMGARLWSDRITGHIIVTHGTGGLTGIMTATIIIIIRDITGTQAGGRGIMPVRVIPNST